MALRAVDVSEVELSMHRDPRGLGHMIQIKIADQLCQEARLQATKACASHLAKLAIRQRPKARAWARHHMRRVAKEV
jgi:hypothetical protein